MRRRQPRSCREIHGANSWSLSRRLQGTWVDRYYAPPTVRPDRFGLSRRSPSKRGALDARMAVMALQSPPPPALLGTPAPAPAPGPPFRISLRGAPFSADSALVAAGR